MITTMWTKAPADLLGLGSSDVRRCTGMATGIAVSPALRPPVAPVRQSGVPAGDTAARLRPVFRQACAQVQFSGPDAALTHNSIGNTLGICPSRRPLS
jgi:hypothetical protein